MNVHTQGDEAVIWFRTVDGRLVRLRDQYRPGFYVLPKSPLDGEDLYRILGQHPRTYVLCFDEKYTTLGSKEKSRLLHVQMSDISGYGEILRNIENLPNVERVYNTDLLHVQQYLFTSLNVAPTSKVELCHKGGRIDSLVVLDDSEEIQPPPFTVLLFDIKTETSILTPNPGRDPISAMETKHDGEEFLLYGDEAEILRQFSDTVRDRDPDFLVCPRCDDFTLPYLLKRAELLGLDLQLGRENWKTSLRNLTLYGVSGRVFLEYSYFQESGIAGLVELSRFSVMPPSVASRWTANRVIDSRNCFELVRRGYVIPRNVGCYEFVRPLNTVVDRDRGGLIIAPRIGSVHENVSELDFESQYPNLIVRDGLSYETVTPQGLVSSGEALLPYVTKRFLERRLRLKRLRKKYAKDSQEWTWCEQRQSSLKSILVCLYGTSGCCWNRFGNVLCFEEINSKSRETLVKTKDFVQQRGFEVVYADTDSIFVKRHGATRQEYEALASQIQEHVGLPIALDHHYRFLLLLALEADPSGNMEAEKRYFGILTDGELLMRGIESRRHDTPEFIKSFQQQLIRTLFGCKSSEEVASTGYQMATRYVLDTVDKIAGGNVPVDQLVVSKILRRPIDSYRVMSPHVAAAVNLAYHGKTIADGETVDFVFVNAKHHNPLRRVVPAAIYRDDYYDCEKYSEMVLDAAETVLSTFGFSRRSYGLKSRTSSFRKEFWE